MSLVESLRAQLVGAAPSRRGGRPVVAAPLDDRGRLALHEFLGGAVSVVDEEHSSARPEAVRYQCPEGVEPLERYMREPESEQDHVVAAVWLPGEDVGVNEAHPIAGDPGPRRWRAFPATHQ